MAGATGAVSGKARLGKAGVVSEQGDGMLVWSEDHLRGLVEFRLADTASGFTVRRLEHFGHHGEALRAGQLPYVGRQLSFSFRAGRLRVYGLHRPHRGAAPQLYDMTRQVPFGLGRLLENVDSTTARNEILAAVADRALVSAAEHDLPVPEGVPGALDTLSALSFPLLRLPLEHGATAGDEVPLAISQVASRPDARSAAVFAFGRRADRAVIRGLAAGLLPREATTRWCDTRPRVRFEPLIAARIGARCLPAAYLEDLLGAPGPTQELASLPSPDELRIARRLVGHYSPKRAKRFLDEAISRPEGLRLLRDAALLHDLAGVAPDGVRTLDELHDILVAEARARTLPDDVPLSFPAEVWELDGRAITDRLRFVVPATTGDLHRWSDQMHNCITGYGTPAARGSIWLLGVTRDDTLVYNLEIRPTRGLVQFSGPRNQAPDPVDAAAVRAALEATPLLTGEVAPVLRDLPPAPRVHHLLEPAPF